MERPGGHRETLAEAPKGHSLEPREGARQPTPQSQTIASTLGEHTFQFFSVPQVMVLCHGSPRKQITYPNFGKELEIDFSPNISFHLTNEKTEETQRQEGTKPKVTQETCTQASPDLPVPSLEDTGFLLFFLFLLVITWPQSVLMLLSFIISARKKRFGSLCVFQVHQAVCFCWLCMKTARLLAPKGDGLTRVVT